MIKVRFNPKALTREGQIVKELPYAPGRTVLWYVNRFASQVQPIHKSDVYFVLSGKKITSRAKVRNGDEIIILPIVRFPLAGLAGLWFALALTADIIAVAVTIYSIVAAFQQNAKTPSYGTNNDSSPTYGFDGIQNNYEQGQPVPVVYGTMRTGGTVIGEYVAVGSSVTLGGGSNPEVDNNYLNVLLALCEGQVDNIGSVEINGQPIANYQNVTVTTNPGTNSQTPIPAFQQVHDLRSVNEQLTQSVPEVYTTFNAVDAIELHFLMPNGLFAQDQNSGQLESMTVTFLVEYKLHSSGTWLTYETVSMSAQSQAAQRFIVRLDNTNVITANGIYDVRVTQTSQNSDFYHTTYLTWDTTDEIDFQDLSYPNTALLALNALATSQLSGSTPTITALIRGIMCSVPNVLNSSGSLVVWDNYYYDPSSTCYKMISNGSTLFWDGSTFVTAYTANPVWCVRDLLTNKRYGLGQFVSSSMIDLPSFIANSQYCENLVSNGSGGMEKRLQLNIILDQNQRVMDWLGAMCSSFRGLCFYSCGTVKIKIDQPGTPVQLFTMGNIREKGFSQTWLPLKQRYNSIQIQYLDASLDYQNNELAVVDDAALAAGQPLRQKSLRMYSTSASQAYREAQILLWMNKYITRMVNLKVDIDAITCESGDLIDVAHDVPEWGIQSGHVQSGSTTSAINLDYPVTIPSGGTYAILIRHAADDTREERQITNAPGTYSTVNLSSALTEVAAGDVYSIGQMSLESKWFRVNNIKYNTDFTAEIQAIEYNPSIYNNTTLPKFTNASALSNQVPNVTDLKATSDYVIKPDGTILNAIDVYFNPPSPLGIYVLYQSANVYISDNGGGNWIFAGNTYGGYVQLTNNLLKGTTYTIAVCSVDARGKQVLPPALSPQATVTVQGKTSAPSTVLTFLVNQNKTAFKFSWSPVSDLDLAGYEIRQGSAWLGGQVLATDIANTTSITLNITTGTTVFWIASIDTSGNYSTPTQAVVVVQQIPYQNIQDTFAEEPGWSGTLVDLNLISSVLEVAATYVQGTYSTPVRDLGYVATFTISASAVVTIPNSTLMNSSSTLLMNSDLTERMSGANTDLPAQLYIKTSQDNITWTAWQPFQSGDYICRYFQIAMIVARTDTSTVIQASALDYIVDLPSVVDTPSGSVSIAASGVYVNFIKTFHKNPAVNVTILSGAGVIATVTNISTTDCLVTLYNSSLTPQTGAFVLTVNGV